ncbi:MAG: TPR end-of-group domain-containing protein [Candidatus Anammoxibacter sp.]
MKTKREFVSSESISSSSYKFKISNVLLQKKEIDFNISFYEGILKNNPCLVECLNFLGNAYTATGMYAKGLEVDKKLSRLRPNDSVIIYNLACSYSLTEEIDLAISSLAKAIEFGYNDIEQLEADSDIDNIRDDKRYIELINSLRKNKRAAVATLKL